MLTFKPLAKPLEICRDLDQLLPFARPLFTEFEKRCETAGIFLRRTETYRDPKRSADLHRKNPKAAADAGMSMHNYRVACDYCINSKTDTYNTHLLTQAGMIWESMGGKFIWGGDWNHDKKVGNDGSIDMPHFQVVSIAEQPTIRAMKYDWDKIEKYLRGRK